MGLANYIHYTVTIWSGQSHGLLIFAILLRLCEEAHLGRRGNPVLCDIKHKLSCLIYQDLDCFTPKRGFAKTRIIGLDTIFTISQKS
jgi:hypothetical protein